MSEAEKDFIKEARKQYSAEGIFGGMTYGCPIPSKGFKHATSICQNLAFGLAPKAKILVVGAGMGYELVVFHKYGYECYGIDLYIPDIKAVKERSIYGSANAMPFKDKEFNLVFCAEMMEHVPSEMTYDVLNECKRVAKSFYFTIATTMDTGYDTHINLLSGTLWIKIFQDLGFNLQHAQIIPLTYIVLGGHHIIRYVCKNLGVSMYGLC